MANQYEIKEITFNLKALEKFEEELLDLCMKHDIDLPRLALTLSKIAYTLGFEDGENGVERQKIQ